MKDKDTCGSLTTSPLSFRRRESILRVEVRLRLGKDQALAPHQHHGWNYEFTVYKQPNQNAQLLRTGTQTSFPRPGPQHSDSSAGSPHMHPLVLCQAVLTLILLKQKDPFLASLSSWVTWDLENTCERISTVVRCCPSMITVGCAYSESSKHGAVVFIYLCRLSFPIVLWGSALCP